MFFWREMLFAVVACLVEMMREMRCCENLVYWPSEGSMCSAVAAQFAHCFFAMMRNPMICFTEAFAIATRSVQLLCDSKHLT